MLHPPASLLLSQIKAEDLESSWTIENNTLAITMEKVNQMEWWTCVVEGQYEINTRKVRKEYIGSIGQVLNRFPSLDPAGELEAVGPRRRDASGGSQDIAYPAQPFPPPPLF